MCRTNLITITGLVLVGGVFATESVFAQAPQELRPPQLSLRVNPPHSSTDKAIKHDYDIVYVRAPRFIRGKDGKDRPAPVWPNAGEPTNLRAPTDLMLLHPDGSEELLVAGGKGAIADPYVSFEACSRTSRHRCAS